MLTDAQQSFVKFFVEEEPWMREASCKGTDSTLFFPDKGGSTSEAKKLCNSCPVAWECDEYAHRTHSSGVWAGKSRRLGNEVTAYFPSHDHVPEPQIPAFAA